MTISARAGLSMAISRTEADIHAVPLDDAALRAGLERHHAESFGWAMHCCGRRRDEAENALQLSYLKVLSGKAVFEGRSSFKTWLFSVIRLTAASERRADFLRRLRLAGLRRDRHAGDSSSASDAMERDQVRSQLATALQALPARQRDVVHLVFYHDLSISDAAGVMGIGLGSARTHYERAKRRIRELIETPLQARRL